MSLVQFFFRCLAESFTKLGAKTSLSDARQGFYEANDIPVNWTVPQIAVLPYGTWRASVIFDWGTDARPRLISCFITELTTHPKL